ncbi:NADH-cytochrome b5 reductase-like [Sitophilus oryzae]|uniref:NADH-cytochrome b5 reductase-like n=1 Tax=Sitophilus oryzae TaxID=7048 RepID=A0A6J2XN87_SITOR|nr:NADH-cytochrome b5 reductase-like [Sitophilus oryzae]
MPCLNYGLNQKILIFRCRSCVVLEMNFPVKPNDSDCCNSGCNPCIFDVYEAQLKKYKNFQIISEKRNCITSTSYTVFKLLNIEKHTTDSYLYTFEYVHSNSNDSQCEKDKLTLFYEPGQYFLLKSPIDDGKSFCRAYTPIFIEDQPSLQFTIVVKIYENGKMSKYLKLLEKGSETLWRGPYGDFRVNFSWKNILFIAQGTGIAPVYSILCAMLENEECYTVINLSFCCTIDNIILHDKIYSLAHYWNFKYELFISNPTNKTFSKKYNEIVHNCKLKKCNIESFIKSAKNIKFIICGSELFSESIQQILVESDIKQIDIIVL